MKEEDRGWLKSEGEGTEWNMSAGFYTRSNAEEGAGISTKFCRVWLETV